MRFVRFIAPVGFVLWYSLERPAAEKLAYVLGLLRIVAGVVALVILVVVCLELACTNAPTSRRTFTLLPLNRST
jgi:hypothetical protein